MEQTLKRKKRPMGYWIDAIHEGVGRMVNVETSEGIVRSAKLTGTRSRQLMLNGEVCEFITEIELNGDPTDTMNILSLKKISIS